MMNDFNLKALLLLLLFDLFYRGRVKYIYLILC